MRRFLAFFVVAVCGFAQRPYATSIEPSSGGQEIAASRGAAALWQSLKKLHTRARLIMVTAHPDDEDGGMLAYESRGQGARVALLTLNRGEGGANVMLSDYFDALGLVRTMELLKAGEYYGVNQYWTRVIDYGFSKTKAESLSRWTHYRVVYDVVRVVRMVRPLVVTSVFVGAPAMGTASCRANGAGSVPGGRRPECVSGSDCSGAEALAAAERLRSCTVPNAAGRSNVYNERRSAGRQLRSAAWHVVCAVVARRIGASKITERRRHDTECRAISQRVSSLRLELPAQDKEASFFDGIDISLAGIATPAPDSDTGFLKAGLAWSRRIRVIASRKATLLPVIPCSGHTFCTRLLLTG